MNNLQKETIKKLQKILPHAHLINIKVSIDGEWQEYEADFLKEILVDKVEIESIKCEHNFQIVRSNYYKPTEEIGILGLPTYKQDIVYSMLCCTKCGETKEIITC